MLKKVEIIRSKQIDHIHSEYNILRQINHPFIVKKEKKLNNKNYKKKFQVEFKGLITSDPRYLYFILEYIAGGELFTLLRTQGNFPVVQAK